VNKLIGLILNIPILKTSLHKTNGTRTAKPLSIGGALLIGGTSLLAACGDTTAIQKMSGCEDIDGDQYFVQNQYFNPKIDLQCVEVQDCNDKDPNTYPGANEIPYDSLDQDCNGLDLVDVDRDGATSDLIQGGTDCDDNNSVINPSAQEICNGGDENCNGKIDEGVTINYYIDADQDLFGNPDAIPEQACIPPNSLYVTNNLDCNDTNKAVFPGASETCDNLDNDCDGEIDEDGKNTYYLDADRDNYGSPYSSATACASPMGYVYNSEDCDDNNPYINPSIGETCNGIDDNCNGVIDDGAASYQYYPDKDLDLYGDIYNSILACTQPYGYIQASGDCNDDNPIINPSAQEVCDQVDNDCDGMIDEVATTSFYRDEDGDNYGDPYNATAGCTVPDGYAENAHDCNDKDSSIHPGAEEICDRLDNDCNGIIDDPHSSTYGGESSDSAEALAPYYKADGSLAGYVGTGYTKSYGSGGKDVILFTTDLDGNIIQNNNWPIVIGGLYDDYGMSVAHVPNEGGFMVFGGTRSVEVGEALWFIRINEDGLLLWEKKINETQAYNYIGRGVVITEKNGKPAYIATALNTHSSDTYVIKLDHNGDIVWTNNLGLSDCQENPEAILATSDGGFIIAGDTNYPDKSYRNGFLMKIDSTGTLVWANYALGGRNNEELYDVIEIADGFVAVGRTYSYGPEDGNIWAIKTDKNGNALWIDETGDLPVYGKFYGGNNFDNGKAVVKTVSGFMIFGKTNSGDAFDGAYSDALMLNIGSLGEQNNYFLFGESGEECFNSGLLGPSNYLFGAGYTDSRNYSNGDLDIVIVKACNF